jgi:hypothetical protein
MSLRDSSNAGATAGNHPYRVSGDAQPPGAAKPRDAQIETGLHGAMVFPD